MTLDTDWHQHEMHQFAAWIPAGTPHRTTLHNVKEAKLIIPTCGDVRVGKIIAYTMEHLSQVRIDDVCVAVSMSERTLRRRFTANMGLS